MENTSWGITIPSGDAAGVTKRAEKVFAESYPDASDALRGQFSAAQSVLPSIVQSITTEERSVVQGHLGGRDGQLNINMSAQVGAKK
jgi:hypothetical protein